jgi:hypothetical protein
VVGMALLTLVTLAMGLTPARVMTLDCNRARGNCTEAARTIPVGNVRRATLVKDHRGGSRGYRVNTVTFGLELTDDKTISICSVPRDDPAATQLTKDLTRANAFFASPTTASLEVKCNEDQLTLGERIYYPVTSIVLLVMGFFGLRLLPKERVEVDGSTRTLRVRGAFGSGTKQRDVAFSDVEAVELGGPLLLARLRSGPPLMIGSARTPAENELLQRAKSRIEAMLASG